MKKSYESPKVQLEELELVDVIMSSSENGSKDPDELPVIPLG